VFFVRSAEQIPCPCYSGKLVVIGNRRRIFINSTGDKIILVIRRLRCRHCHRIHHELPDILVPYKRHVIDSLESVLTENSTVSVAADESSIVRWRNWFLKLSNYLLGCLASIAIRYDIESVEGMSSLPKSTLQRIWEYVGDAPGWLARVVRPIVNLNLWIHTRSAFLA